MELHGDVWGRASDHVPVRYVNEGWAAERGKPGKSRTYKEKLMSSQMRMKAEAHYAHCLPQLKYNQQHTTTANAQTIYKKSPKKF